ncbi:response regulator [candidate division WOR-3 bacterium]|jgi:two-component system chemotaxis response regulator CheY|nr:response regulator [candidate division WOR-3 bacterium]
MKILIVDDALFMRHMLHGIFEKAGHVVCGEATTGKEAIEKYKECQPDLTTMDIIMPDMSGAEAIKEIKKIDPDAKILVISAMGQRAILDEVVRAGAADYVIKPFPSARILEAIERIVGKE